LATPGDLMGTGRSSNAAVLAADALVLVQRIGARFG
jgi:hypothetical protein